MPYRDKITETRREDHEINIPLLVRLYSDQMLTVDMLPYSSYIQIIITAYHLKTGYLLSESQVYNTLVTLHKSHLLPQKGYARIRNRNRSRDTGKNNRS